MTSGALERSSISRVEGELSPSDYNQLSGLIRNARFEKGIITRQQIDEDLANFTNREKAALFLAHNTSNMFIDPEVAGFLTAKSDPETGGLHVDRLFVDSWARGRKLGWGLLQACVEFAQSGDAQATHVLYDHAPDSEAEQAMLSDLGFQQTENGDYRRSL